MATNFTATTQVQGRLAAMLALVAGYVDSYTLLNFQVYTSFMSGNTTQAGLHTGEGQWAAAGHRLLPIPLFVVGVAAGTLLVEGGLRRPVRLLCILVAALLITSLAASFLPPFANWGQIVLLSFAMGALNTSITQVGGQKVGLGYVTGDLYNVGRYLALAARGVRAGDGKSTSDHYGWRVAVLATIWTSFLIGAALAGVAMLWIGKWVLIAPAVVLCLLPLFERVDLSAAGNLQSSSEQSPGVNHG